VSCDDDPLKRDRWARLRFAIIPGRQRQAGEPLVAGRGAAAGDARRGGEPHARAVEPRAGLGHPKYRWAGPVAESMELTDQELTLLLDRVNFARNSQICNSSRYGAKNEQNAYQQTTPKPRDWRQDKMPRVVSDARSMK